MSYIKGNDDANPSNILYRGECQDFYQAMRLVQAQCANEKTWVEMNRPGDDEARSEGCWGTGHLDAYAAAADTAEAIYTKHIHAAVSAAWKEMQAHADDDVRQIGDAVETGHYSTLAI